MPKILIADDDAAVRDLIRSLLERVGYAVAEAGSGEQTIEMATSEDPGLILLDIVMPGIGGIEALRRLKADPATADIPVGVLSAQHEIALVKECVELGASDYLGKPCRHGWLLTTVKEILEISSHDYAFTGTQG